MAFGNTANGVDWCVKALHPSDPLTEVRGIPDHTAVPSLLMNYQSTFTLSPLPGATGTWGFNASLLPHPIDFMAIENFDDFHQSPALSVCDNFLNTQVAGTTHSEKFEAFAGMVQRWRLAYMSVTCYQDGPDLANQGSIVCAQPPVKPRQVAFSYVNTTSVKSLYPTEFFTAEDMPVFDVLQAEPNAYFGRSKDGAYVPLKLTETCQDWVSESDVVTSGFVASGVPTGQVTLDSTVNPIPYYPHYTLEPARIVVAAHIPQSAHGERTSPMLNGTFAHICARNLGLSTSFAFFVRCGIEMQVTPSSVLSPQLKLAPPQDPLAIDTYFAIARELKDAYPAEYNDLGLIWDAISPVARKVSKVLKAVPLVPGTKTLAGIIDLGVDIGDWARSKGKPKTKSKSKKKKKKVPGKPQGDLPGRRGRPFKPETPRGRAMERETDRKSVV